jgi:hypothetical protein
MLNKYVLYKQLKDQSLYCRHKGVPLKFATVAGRRPNLNIQFVKKKKKSKQENQSGIVIKNIHLGSDTSLLSLFQSYKIIAKHPVTSKSLSLFWNKCWEFD